MSDSGRRSSSHSARSMGSSRRIVVAVVVPGSCSIHSRISSSLSRCQ